ncbi:hypothetical protein ACH50O_09235 [Methylomonas sp. 2BW1-5-20]|uniref:hypothetical protein n=1 Tax=Methylomonas sp. 2BW1-5-20 TaxID=3376686 RepID=UPI0040531E54
MMSEQIGGYPSRNPFPYLGTLRLAGQRLEGGVPVIGDFRTLDRGPVTKLITRSNEFIDRFEPKWSNQGEVVVIRGAHGSGKTHTICATWRMLRKQAFPIYVLLQNSDFLSLYTQIVQRLSPTLLKEMSLSFLGAITAEQLASQAGSSEPTTDLNFRLQNSPDLVASLFSSYKVEERVAVARQEKALDELSQGEKNLQRAVFCLQGDQFDNDAAAWFRAEPVARERLDAMGISSEIETPEQAVSAIQMLAALFAISNRPLVLFIDQIERLVVDDDSVTATANMGYLRSILEMFVSRNAMLVLSGNEEAWKKLHVDLRSRVALSVIDCPLLGLNEAIDIVRLYVMPLGTQFKPGAGSLYPFTEGAVRTMLTLGAGNPRRFLQFCYSAFAKAASSNTVIDEYLVTSMTREEYSEQFFDRAQVDQETHLLLSREPFRFEQRLNLHGITFDYALLSNTGGPLLLLDVKDAIFADEEAANAISSADVAEKLKAFNSTAYYVVVVKGYVSPEIVEKLRNAVHELIIYTKDTFEQQLNALLMRVRERALGILRESSPSEQSIRDIREALLNLKLERAGETNLINSRVEDFSKSHTRRRYEERYEKARSEWIAMRRKIEEDIMKGRKECAEKAISEMNTQTHQKLRNLKIRSAVIFFSLFFWISSNVAIDFNDALKIQSISEIKIADSYNSITKNTMDSADKAEIPVGNIYRSILREHIIRNPFSLILIYYLIIEWLPVFISPGFTQPIKDLRQIEQFLMSRRGFYVKLFPFISGFPAIRLYKKASRIRKNIGFTELEELVVSEPLSILRQLLCKMISGKEIFNPKGLVVGEELMRVPEISILIQKKHFLENVSTDSLQHPIDLVYTLATGKIIEKPRLAMTLCALITDNYENTSNIANAFRIGLDKAKLETLSFLSERDIQGAIRDLTPFESGGLGTYDFLDNIKRIDELFLFCLQLRLYYEYDLLLEGEL